MRASFKTFSHFGVTTNGTTVKATVTKRTVCTPAIAINEDSFLGSSIIAQSPQFQFEIGRRTKCMRSSKRYELTTDFSVNMLH